MRDDFTIFAGTVGMGGAGIWRSPDGGKTWSVPRGSKDEMNCCALAVHPSNPSVIYAGLRNGIYRSDDHGKHFYRLESPVNAYEVWSVVVDAVDPSIVFVGCRPGRDLSYPRWRRALGKMPGRVYRRRGIWRTGQSVADGPRSERPQYRMGRGRGGRHTSQHRRR